MRLGPLDFVRLDAAVVERVREGRDLPPIAGRAVLTITLGGAAYGGVFGAWRAPEAALASAVKLPLLFLGVVAITTFASAFLAPVLRSSLTVGRAAVVTLFSFATTASVLGGLALPMLYVVLSLPPVDPELGDRSTAIAQSLVLGHTTMIALAGIAGVLRLLSLLERLGDPPRVARRVVVGWIATQFLVGAELSWRLRPFLGGPSAPVRFLAADAFEGSFFDEVARLGVARFGAGAPWLLALFGVIVAVWMATVLRSPPDDVTVDLDETGLLVRSGAEGGRHFSWPSVRRARADGAFVLLFLVADAALDERALRVRCRDSEAAATLAARIEAARRRPVGGPFRAAAV